MILGQTLSLYFAKTFLRSLLLVFLLFLFLIIVVDLVELSRDLSKTEGVSFVDILLITLYRAPSFAENMLPFAIMFGASVSLLLLNRKLELVIARASGVSVWQFLFPFMITAALVGLFATLIYNPLSLAGSVESRSLEARVFGKLSGALPSSASKNFWIRLNQRQGDVIVRARVAENGGQKLSAASFYRFGPDGEVLDRIDAGRAIFATLENGQNVYRLERAVVTVPGQKSARKKQMDVPVEITLRRLQERTGNVSDVSFWKLGEQWRAASESGRSPLPFQTHFQSLLSQPLLFVAMVLLAATVSLRFARFGQSGKAILGGIVAGFVLYVASRLVVTFGSNGLVSPFIAAWSPALVATLICATVLLYQEDG